MPGRQKHPPPQVCKKAIKIANALLGDGMDEGKPTRIAIAKAKQWSGRQAGLINSALSEKSISILLPLLQKDVAGQMIRRGSCD